MKAAILLALLFLSYPLLASPLPEGENPEKQEHIDALDESVELLSKEQFKQAAILLCDLRAKEITSTGWVMASFNLGIALRLDGKYDDVIKIFHEVLESDVNDRDPAPSMKEEKLNIGDTGSFVYQGTTYTWKVMDDGKKWLTQNLNVKVENSWCYNNDPNHSEKYGRLYTWEAAKEACLELGNNWRVPSDEDWQKLAIEYGGYHDWKSGKDIGSPIEAYRALMEKGSSGFSARLAGWRDPGGSFDYFGDNGIFWSSSLLDSSDARGFGFYRGNSKMARGNGDCNFGHSVRCVQDL